MKKISAQNQHVELMTTKARLIVKLNALIAVGDIEGLEAVASELRNIIKKQNIC